MDHPSNRGTLYIMRGAKLLALFISVFVNDHSIRRIIFPRPHSPCMGIVHPRSHVIVDSCLDSWRNGKPYPSDAIYLFWKRSMKALYCIVSLEFSFSDTVFVHVSNFRPVWSKNFAFRRGIMKNHRIKNHRIMKNHRESKSAECKRATAARRPRSARSGLAGAG